MLGDGVADLAAEDVVEAGEGASLVAQPEEILVGIPDAPASEGVQHDVGLVLGGHVRGTPVQRMTRFSRRFTSWMNGSLRWRPALVTAGPTGFPNWVMMTCSVSLTV